MRGCGGEPEETQADLSAWPSLIPATDPSLPCRDGSPSYYSQNTPHRSRLAPLPAAPPSPCPLLAHPPPSCKCSGSGTSSGIYETASQVRASPTALCVFSVTKLTTARFIACLHVFPQRDCSHWGRDLPVSCSLVSYPPSMLAKHLLYDGDSKLCVERINE